MLKKVSLALVLASLVSTTALADGSHATTSASGGEDHLVLKARAGWLNSKSSGSFTSTGEAAADLLGIDPDSLTSTENGYLGELALGYFFTDNIAAEVSIGYGKSTNSDNKLGVVPVALLAQYHFMPEAAVSPYVGVGYSYQFITNVPSGVKISNGGGVVGQVGLDIPYNDTMGFNIDAKYTYKASHDISLGNVTLVNSKMSTTAVTAGVTFSF